MHAPKVMLAGACAPPQERILDDECDDLIKRDGPGGARRHSAKQREHFEGDNHSKKESRCKQQAILQLLARRNRFELLAQNTRVAFGKCAMHQPGQLR